MKTKKRIQGDVRAPEERSSFNRDLLVRTAYRIGIKPAELWDMELWEFNACVAEYNKMQEEKDKEQIALCWQTANFTGAAFAGKLRKLSHYLKDNQKAVAPKVSKDEFNKKLAEAERRLADGS